MFKINRTWKITEKYLWDKVWHNSKNRMKKERRKRKKERRKEEKKKNKEERKEKRKKSCELEMKELGVNFLKRNKNIF